MNRKDVLQKVESLLNSVDGDKVRMSNKLLADLIVSTVEETEVPASPWRAVVSRIADKRESGTKE